MEIILVLNIHFDLFSWVSGTHKNILTWTKSTQTFITILLLILRISISLYYLATIINYVIYYSYVFVENFHVNNLVLKIFHAFNFRGARVPMKII